MEQSTVVSKKTRSRENVTGAIAVETVKASVNEVTKNGNETDLITFEGDHNIINYLGKLGIDRENDLIVLPSNRHYYYDESELKKVNTVVNLKKLNFIKNLDKFLHTMLKILPPGASLIGCFADTGSAREKNGFPLYNALRFKERLNNLLDLRTNNDMDRKEVSDLFKSYGFEIVDMKVMNGLTYFYSKNNLKSFN
jgi:hypothetical protein